jgi:hypothetical protein
VYSTPWKKKVRKVSLEETKRTVMFGSNNSKLRQFNSVVRPVITYASETCVLKEQIENKLLTIERKIRRRISGSTTQPDGTRRRKTNEDLNNLIKQKKKIMVKHIKAQTSLR